MNIRQSSICSFVLFILASVSTASAFQTSGTEVLDFGNWDHDAITVTGGQMFEDICGTADVMVDGGGSFAAPSEFGTTSAGAASIRTEVAGPSGSHFYNFTLSEPTPIVIDFDLLDASETIMISSIGAASPAYTHAGGAAPTMTSSASEVMLTGNAYGNGSNGAAYGSVDLGMVTQFRIAYDIQGGGPVKYNAFTIGKGSVVPEPNSQGLFAMGLIGLFGLGRKRRNA